MRSSPSAARCAPVNAVESADVMTGKPRGRAPERAAKVGLQAGIGGVEQLSPRDDHDVEHGPVIQRGDPPKNLSYQTLSPISFDRIAQLLRRDDSEPGCA